MVTMGSAGAPPAYDATLDRWVDRARRRADAPVALLAVADEDGGPVVVAACGLDGLPSTEPDTPLGRFCRHVVRSARPLAIADAREHALLRDARADRDAALLAYAGAPFVTSAGLRGTLCVADRRPHAWTDAALDGVLELAAVVSVELQLRAARSDLARSRALVGSLNRVHELIADDAALADILGTLVACFEATDPELVGSVLLLEGDTLRHGAAPGLPHAYTAAIDGSQIGPAAGTCGAAAWWGHEVVTADLRRDPAWAPYRALAEPHGLVHCWSAPIKARDGAVLGTFALYGRRARTPGDDHLALMRDASRLAGIAVERTRGQEALRHEATHDHLTGLPNRRLVGDRLAQALARARRSGTAVAVVFVDLDGLKLINDALGHGAGD